MPKFKSRKKKSPKRVLALPDLEQAKTAVLNSLTSASGQRTYEHALATSSPGTARTPVSRSTAPSFFAIGFTSSNAITRPLPINLRLAAVRRIAYEAADAGLLSPELAAGIRRSRACDAWASGLGTG